MNLSVKLFINEEVRRFMFNGTSYGELYDACGKVASFPPKGILQYYDDEGDYVTFSSDSEFQYAVSLLKDPRIFRVRALVTQDPASAVPTPADSHPSEGRGYRHRGHHKEYKRRVKDFDVRFVGHVNYDDGSKVAPNSSFEKTWKLRNNGANRWLEGTGILRVDRANELSAALFTPFTGALPAPDAEVQVSVKLQAPALPGEYSCYFKMVSPGGKKFGQRIRCQVVVVKDAPQAQASTTTTMQAADQHLYQMLEMQKLQLQQLEQQLHQHKTH